MGCLFRARDLLFSFHYQILYTAKSYLKEMGRRLRTHISSDCILLENKENIKELAFVKGRQKRGLCKFSEKSLKNTANMPNIKKLRKHESIAEEKQTAMSYKVALKKQTKLLDCDDDSIKSDKTKSLRSHDSNQNVRQELKKQDFSQIKNSQFHDPRVTKEAVVLLERYEDVQKVTDFRATTDNSDVDLKNDKKVEKIHSKAQNSISQSECHGSLLLKEAVVVLERYEDIQEKSSDSSKNLLEEGGKAKEVPKKSDKSTKRKRDKKSAEEETSKPSKSKKQKVSSESKSSKKEIPDLKAVDFNNDSKSTSGISWNFKISSWNVNGIRAWLEKNGISFLHHEQPDIMCIQETKCSDDKLPDEMQKIEGYHCYWLSGDKEGYSGVGLLSKEKPIKVVYGIGISEHDNEGRVITAEYDKFYLVSTYVPNAGRGLVRLDYRMKWDKDFREYLKKLDAEKPVILTGDLNVAHEEIDLANPKTNKKNAGFTKEERDGFTALLGEGFIDTFRHLYPDKKGAYTFWTYMMNARAKDVGWRLDYFVISERFTENLCDNVIRKEVHGSDHCPITLFLSL